MSIPDSAGPESFGIPWYRREDYDGIRQAMADGDSLPESYAYWLSSAESVEAAVQTVGKRVVRVELDLPVFLAWCRDQGLQPNSGARSRYAAAMVSQGVQGPPV